ncbi:MAG: hypothetical protein AB1632_08290 [Nitrospirota bacterium]
MKVKKVLYLPLSVLAVAFISYAGLAAADVKKDFQKVVDNLDLRKNTKLHVREYWKEIEGKEVVWSGIVFDVRGGRGKAEVLVANKIRPAVRGYNIALIVYDVSRAAKLKKGQRIKFKGYLHGYSAGRHGGIVITLRDAEIL